MRTLINLSPFAQGSCQLYKCWSQSLGASHCIPHSPTCADSVCAVTSLFAVHHTRELPVNGTSEGSIPNAQCLLVSFWGLWRCVHREQSRVCAGGCFSGLHGGLRGAQGNAIVQSAHSDRAPEVPGSVLWCPVIWVPFPHRKREEIQCKVHLGNTWGVGCFVLLF